MDISSINFGADNYQAARAISLSQNQGILASIPGAENSPFTLDFMNQVQDSKLISARVIDYYDAKVDSTVKKIEDNGVDVVANSENVTGYNEKTVDELANDPKNSEDIKTIVDEILARTEEVSSGVLLDLKA